MCLDIGPVALPKNAKETLDPHEESLFRTKSGGGISSLMPAVFDSLALANFEFSAFNKKRIGYKDTSSSKLSKKLQKNRRFYQKQRFWSECRDSNSGPPAPKAGALPTALHPDKSF